MRRDLNVKFYVGEASEVGQLKNPGDFFRAEDTGELFLINKDGIAEAVGASPANTSNFIANLSQIGTSAPQLDILKQDGEFESNINFTLSRSNTGVYTFSFPNSFGDIRTRLAVNLGSSVSNVSDRVLYFLGFDSESGNSFITIYSRRSEANSDNVLRAATLTLELYPE